MIETKTITIDGVEYISNVSTSGKIIEGGFPLGYYEEAIDPIDSGRTFIELDKYFPNEEYPQWNSGIAYMKDETVTHNFIRYRSYVNNNIWEPGTEDWCWREI